MSKPKLRYEISNWVQATKCLSNNSKSLHITVSDFIMNPHLTGTRVAVESKQFGTLFAVVVNPRGSYITEEVDGNLIPQLTTSQILEQLALYGFYIIFKQEQTLSGDQLSYLMDLQRLGYDKITRIHVAERTPDHGIKVTRRIVAIDLAENQDLIDFDKKLTFVDYSQRMKSGVLSDITDASHDRKFEWDWLSYTIAIEDILDANMTSDESTELHEYGEVIDLTDEDNGGE